MEAKAMYSIFQPQKRRKIGTPDPTTNHEDAGNTGRPMPVSDRKLDSVMPVHCHQNPVADGPSSLAQSSIVPPLASRAAEGLSISQSQDNLPMKARGAPSEPAKAASLSASVATGALATLMKAGRVKSSCQRFHLDIHEDGTHAISWQTEPTAANSQKNAWKAEMKFRDGHTKVENILLLSAEQASSAKEQSLSWESHNMLSNKDQGRRPRLSASLLKSAIQKNVRLCRPGPAVRASLHLMKESWSEFLRRATIIALEDGILHPDLPFLMWLTAAVAKGYQPSRMHAAVCLRIVHELASVRCRDPLSDADEADTQCPSMSDVSKLPAEEATILKALLLRASFGGMAGDVRMLKCYARVWFKRFSGASPPPPPLSTFRSTAADVTSTSAREADVSPTSSGLELSWADWLCQLYAQTPPPPQVLSAGTDGLTTRVVDLAAVPAIMLSDVPPSAVDFHCSNIIEDVLKETPVGRQVNATCRQQGVEAEAVFRSAMWHFRSSINKKKTLSGETDTEMEDGSKASWLWSQLSTEAQKYSLNVVKRRFGVWNSGTDQGT